MILQPVFLQVLVHGAVIPVDDRQHFEHAALDRQHRQGCTAAGLLAAQTRKPGLSLQLFQRAVHRLDFVDLIVFLNALNALLPQLAVARLLPGRAFSGAVDLQVQPELVRQLVNKLVGFREQVAGIGEDHRNVRADLIHQMQADRRLNTKARRQHVVSRQVFQRPRHAPFGVQLFQLGVGFCECQNAFDFWQFVKRV